MSRKCNDIINLLKTNRYPFGMWLDPKCYGPDVGKEMQTKAKEIGRAEFENYRFNREWIRMKENLDFVNDSTYHLRADYTEEPEIVECEIRKKGDGDLHYEHNGDSDIWILISGACNDPDFIGFKFTDGTVHAQPIKYSVPGITSKGYYVSYTDIKTSQALEHHATHVLFQRQK